MEYGTAYNLREVIEMTHLPEFMVVRYFERNGKIPDFYTPHQVEQLCKRYRKPIPKGLGQLELSLVGTIGENTEKDPKEYLDAINEMLHFRD